MPAGALRASRDKGLPPEAGPRKNAPMLKRNLIVTALCAGVLSACVSSNRLVVEQPPAAVPSKQIVRAGTDLVLPDGTRVTPDPTGGFALPNGDYVRREARGGLRLPNGALCTPIAGGYACP